MPHIDIPHIYHTYTTHIAHIYHTYTTHIPHSCVLDNDDDDDDDDDDDVDDDDLTHVAPYWELGHVGRRN
jgi:hypothetical protein